MRFFKSAAKAVPAIARDCAGFAGAGMIVQGVRLIHEPSGFIAGGFFLLVFALILAKR